MPNSDLPFLPSSGSKRKCFSKHDKSQTEQQQRSRKKPRVVLNSSSCVFQYQQSKLEPSVAEYDLDIKFWMKKKENLTQPRPNYISLHPYKGEKEFCTRFREVATWKIAELQMTHRASTESIYLGTMIFDRFVDRQIQHQQISLSRTLILSFAAFHLAAKYDGYSISLKDIVKNVSFTLQEVLAAEAEILEKLDWDFSSPTSYEFLRELWAVEGETGTIVKALSKYILELTHHEYTMLPFLPSLRAASVLFLSRKYFPSIRPWTSTLIDRSGYQESDLKKCASVILELMKKESKAFQSEQRVHFSTVKFSLSGKLASFALSPNYLEKLTDL